MAVDANAPYCTTPIPLFLSSLTGMRYRTLNCVECGAEFLERNNDTLFRLGNTDQPREVAITAINIPAVCGRCAQQYQVYVSSDVSVDRDGIALNLYPESMYLASEQSKKARLVHCMECGYLVSCISDRVAQIVDNRVPFEYTNPDKLGPIQNVCSYYRCKQTWALIV